jgi:hypothetical protein
VTSFSQVVLYRGLHGQRQSDPKGATIEVINVPVGIHTKPPGVRVNVRLCLIQLRSKYLLSPPPARREESNQATMSHHHQAAAAMTTTKRTGLKRTALQIAAAVVFSAYSLRYAWIETSLLLAPKADAEASPRALSTMADEDWYSTVDRHPSFLRGRNLSVEVVYSSSPTLLGSNNNNNRCHIKTEVRLSKEIISPTYLASFHGGGTEITSTLVQSLTGIATTNQVNYAKRRTDHSVLVETHYPRHGALTVDNDSNYRGTILLLRNPIDAILASFNNFYTQQYHLSSTIRAPVEDWIRYRDSAQLYGQIKLYERFIIHWMKKYRGRPTDDNNSRNNLLIVTYEGLTGGKGAIFAKQIANFLHMDGEGVNVVDSISIPCVWEKVVKDHWYEDQEGVAVVAEGTPTPTSFQERTDDRPFTQEQLHVVVTMLRSLDERFGHDKQLCTILNSYINRISGSIMTVA